MSIEDIPSVQRDNGLPDDRWTRSKVAQRMAGHSNATGAITTGATMTPTLEKWRGWSMNKKPKLPDPKRIAENVITLMGGPEIAFAKFDADFEMTAQLWNQNTAIIGRILRCHLFVEHFLTEYLANGHPGLAFDKVRLTFAQKVDLIEGHLPPGVSHIVPGVRRLNSIRNRLSHTLKAELRADDANAFTGIALFEAMRRESAKPHPPSSEPLVIMEAFAQHAGWVLHSLNSPNHEVFRKAVEMAWEQDAEV